MGRKFMVGALLNGCSERQVSDGLVTVSFSHRSHMVRMNEELDYPDVRRAVNETLSGVLGGPHEIVVAGLGTSIPQNTNTTTGSWRVTLWDRHNGRELKQMYLDDFDRAFEEALSHACRYSCREYAAGVQAREIESRREAESAAAANSLDELE